MEIILRYSRSHSFLLMIFLMMSSISFHYHLLLELRFFVTHDKTKRCSDVLLLVFKSFGEQAISSLFCHSMIIFYLSLKLYPLTITIMLWYCYSYPDLSQRTSSLSYSEDLGFDLNLQSQSSCSAFEDFDCYHSFSYLIYEISFFDQHLQEPF